MSFLPKSIIFNKEFFHRKKNDILFVGTGVVLLIVVLWIFIGSISFLSQTVNSAIDTQAQQTSVVQFNVGDLSKLGITQNTSPPTSTTTGR